MSERIGKGVQHGGQGSQTKVGRRPAGGGREVERAHQPGGVERDRSRGGDVRKSFGGCGEQQVQGFPGRRAQGNSEVRVEHFPALARREKAHGKQRDACVEDAGFEELGVRHGRREHRGRRLALPGQARTVGQPREYDLFPRGKEIRSAT